MSDDIAGHRLRRRRELGAPAAARSATTRARRPRRAALPRPRRAARHGAARPAARGGARRRARLGGPRSRGHAAALRGRGRRRRWPRGRAELGAVGSPPTSMPPASPGARRASGPRRRRAIRPGAAPGAGRLVVVWGGAGRAGSDDGRGAPRDRVGASRALDAARRRRRLVGLGRAAARARRVAVGRAGGAPGRPRLADAARRLPAVRARRAGRARGAAAGRALAGGAARGVAGGARRRDRDVRHRGRGRRGADRGGRGARRRPHSVPPQPDDDHRARPGRSRAPRDRRGSRSDCGAASSPTGC